MTNRMSWTKENHYLPLMIKGLVCHEQIPRSNTRILILC